MSEETELRAALRRLWEAIKADRLSFALWVGFVWLAVFALVLFGVWR